MMVMEYNSKHQYVSVPCMLKPKLSFTIQGAVCRFINGLKAQGTPVKDAKVLFYGAGSSAVGVANMIATLFQKEGGLSEKEAKSVWPPFSLGLGLGLRVHTIQASEFVSHCLSS